MPSLSGRRRVGHTLRKRGSNRLGKRDDPIKGRAKAGVVSESLPSAAAFSASAFCQRPAADFMEGRRPRHLSGWRSGDGRGGASIGLFVTPGPIADSEAPT